MAISPEDKEILLTQSETKTLAEWIKFFNNKYTKDQIYGFCYYQRLLIKKQDRPSEADNQEEDDRRWHINENYFKQWTHNMAYTLGLWYAVGNIYAGKVFDITLHAKDKYVLKAIADDMGYKGQLYDYVDQQSARLNFSCDVIYDDIVKLGGPEFRNVPIKFPPKMPKEFLADFVRGYYDGAGGISFMKNDRVNSALTGSDRMFLEVMTEHLRQQADIEQGSYDPINKAIRFGKKDTERLGEFMYKNNPELFLQRKKNKFNTLINI